MPDRDGAASLHQTLAALCAGCIARYADAPLLALPNGRILSHAEGYSPLLVNFTAEDKAAKGLRSLTPATAPPPPVYLSALEVTCENPALLLVGERGSGKTSFAKHLALCLAGEVTGDPRFNLQRLQQPVPRNDLGAIADDVWSLRNVVPLFLPADGTQSFAEHLLTAWPDAPSVLASTDWRKRDHTLLVMIDGLDRLGARGPDLLRDALAFANAHPRVRLLALSEPTYLNSCPAPADFLQHSLLPLLVAQRQAAARQLLADASQCVSSPITANPGLFALCLSGEDLGTCTADFVDNWLRAGLRGLPDNAVDQVAQAAFDALNTGNAVTLPRPLQSSLDARNLTVPLRNLFLIELLSARHLTTMPPTEIAQLFGDAPGVWSRPIASLAERLTSQEPQRDDLFSAMIREPQDRGLRGALAAARLLQHGAPLQTEIAPMLLRLIAKGRLSPANRASAGEILSRWRDPRDLEALADVPGGTFTMGATTTANASPPHPCIVAPFRIGCYPVTNSQYRRFIEATSRTWVSNDGTHPARANAPAADLTWHDARAYCTWLTDVWREARRIGPNEVVRLPTEPEWERAARGDQPDGGADIVYPWAGPWHADRANTEETGFNDTCPVGLYPHGRSPYGCYDMAGQVWEWTSTLWGGDMTTPSFKYPYINDGREALDAGPAIRRVLRGGCFSSGQLKACCTYRGSLEPDGYWRGNGFRIVVAPLSPTEVK